MLLTSNNKEKLTEVRTKLMNAFEMTDLGEPKNFLNLLRRNRETKTMLIMQEKYIEKILNNFGFDDEYPKTTPMITRQVANRNIRERTFEDIDIGNRFDRRKHSLS